MAEEEGFTSQAELRRLQGTILGEQYEELVYRILGSAPEIELEEWFVYVAKWLHRNETREAFMTILQWFRSNPTWKMRGGVEKSNKPGESQVFVNTFLKFLAVDQAVLMLDKLRDPVAYFAFIIASKRRREELRVAIGVRDIGV